VDVERPSPSAAYFKKISLTRRRDEPPTISPIDGDGKSLSSNMRMIAMQAVAENVFKALADPTRRAIFERLTRDGEQTVHALTDHSGVSQPAVSKHLGVLKHAKLVRDRREGRETHYSAQPQALAPLIDWMSLYGAFWRDRFDRLESLLNRMDP
jgi:DNA-binding transcriptional ArsR family regulator